MAMAIWRKRVLVAAREPGPVQLAKRLAARQPAAHWAAIGVIGRAKCGAEMRLNSKRTSPVRGASILL